VCSPMKRLTSCRELSFEKTGKRELNCFVRRTAPSLPPAMAALPPKADIDHVKFDVGFGSIAA
jgi:hypothetical protein